MAENLPINETILVQHSAGEGGPAPIGNGHNALPMGTRMGEFEIIGLIGEGGFGIVYLAQDHSLDRKVALKEYMPSALAARSADAAVFVRSERHEETFSIGLRSFVNEARLLARFDHPALVKVYRFWESNGTAYMAMPYYDGRTLREVFAETPNAPDEATLLQLLAPLLDALELIHAQSCFHRDIAPDNIMLLRDGRPVLLDFGAARRVISDMTQALTVILKPGYAPIEQYAEMPGMKQGPWTDIYALAAVVYYAISRKLPPPSVSRIVQDSYAPLATLAGNRYSQRFLQGLDACLAVKAENRPQSIAAMREALGMHKAAAQAEASPAPANSKPPEPLIRELSVDQDELRHHAPSAAARIPWLRNASLSILLLTGSAAAYLALTHNNQNASQAQVQPDMSPPLSAQSDITPAQGPAVEASVPALSEAVQQVSAPVMSIQAEQALANPSSPLADLPSTESKPVSIAATSSVAAQSSSPSVDSPVTPSQAKASVKKNSKTASPQQKEATDSQAERDYMRQLNKELQGLTR